MGGAERFRTILVDDDAPMRILLRRALERSGRFEVIAEAADGREGIECAKLLQPDLVLLDLMMPVMNGFQALPKIREGVAQAKVVVLSVLHGNPIEKDCLSLGASGFVDKMVTDEELVRRLLATMEPVPSPEQPPLVTQTF